METITIKEQKQKTKKELSDVVLSISQHIKRDVKETLDILGKSVYNMAKFPNIVYLKPNRAVYSGDRMILPIPEYAYAEVDNRVNYAQNRVVGRIYQNR